jgi:hypothetical protein
MTTEPYDDNEIKGDDVIIRRVNPQHHVVHDEITGRSRTSSKLFSPSSQPNGGMSVDILKLMDHDDVDPREFVTTPVFTGSVCFKASAARSVDLMIGRDPIKDVPGVDDNPYHGEVWASGARPNKFNGAQKRALAEASEWFVELPGVDIKS